MIYKLLAINIDGTLLQSNGRFSKATKEAVEYVHDKGVTVVLVTSRNYQSCKKLTKELRIKPMIVAGHGAFVGTTIEKPLFVRKISEQTTMDVVKFLENINCRFTLNFEESQISNRVNLPENFIGKAVMYVSEQTTFSHHYIDQVTEYLNNNPSEPMGIEVIFDNRTQQLDAKKVLNSMFTDISVISKEKHRLSIAPHKVSKWKGILYLADHLNISKHEIVAIGDSKDDQDMISGSGIGVAMGSGHPDLKLVANWITRGNDDDGVAYMIKELFRKQYQLQFLEKMNLLKK